MDTVSPLRVAVAEDEPLARSRLVRLLEEAGCRVEGTFEDGLALLGWLAERPAVDALFLDIQMPGPSGLEVAAELPFPLPVVFVTAFRDHALGAFELAALDYLLKPVKPERLAMALQRLREGLVLPRGATELREALNGPPKVVIRAGEGLLFLDLKKITHFEVDDTGVQAWSCGRAFPTQWKTLADVEATFGAATFERIQRHLLLRPEVLTGLRPLPGNRAMARLGDGTELEVSRTATARLKERLGIRGEFGRRE